MGFEPTTLRDLVGCSTTELLDSGTRIFPSIRFSYNLHKKQFTQTLPVETARSELYIEGNNRKYFSNGIRIIVLS